MQLYNLFHIQHDGRSRFNRDWITAARISFVITTTTIVVDFVVTTIGMNGTTYRHGRLEDILESLLLLCRRGQMNKGGGGMEDPRQDRPIRQGDRYGLTRQSQE